ncbi:hypothetical protein JCM10449v2_004096 [Rhodotorula kratochvilovae]
MLVGVGVDLLHLARLRVVCSRRSHARLASRILCTAELDEFAQLGESAAEKERFLALRWAAKEAAYKALYPTCAPTWKDLAVRKAGPKPLLAWAEDARTSLSPHSALKMHLSVSHDNDQLVAFVVVEKE